MEGAFRKIDIDAYDEDALHESELYDADPRDPSEVLNDVRQRQAAVRSQLSRCVIHLARQSPVLIKPFRNDTVGAIQIVLENAPYGPSNEEAKVLYLT